MSSAVQGLSLPDGYDLRMFDELDGTNAEALRMDCPHGLVIVAREQSAGRGRLQRTWFSAPGNLYATICVELKDAHAAGQLAFVAALAVLETVSKFAPQATFSVKWPNDILYAGQKLSGILIEAGNTGGFAIGIGINLSRQPPENQVRFPATTLEAVLGQKVKQDAVIELLCKEFDLWFRRWQAEGFEPLKDAWLASAFGIGDTIVATTGNGQVKGRFKGLDEDGTLILADEKGKRHFVTAGDVFFPERNE